MPDQPELLERIAKVLREHRPKDVADDKSRPGFRIWRNGCTGCGFTADKDEAIDHFDHLAARLLALPDIAITTVPQPESTTTDIDGGGLKTAQFPHDITAWGGEYPGVMDCDADLSIEVARSLAASLLAAANFAEAGVAEEQTNA